MMTRAFGIGCTLRILDVPFDFAGRLRTQRSDTGGGGQRGYNHQHAGQRLSNNAAS